jgi:hypothetical protein
MAKTNTIQAYRTTTASGVPGASALAAGELAVNLTDKKLFVGDAAGTSYIELTRRAAAASLADTFKVQLADTAGYLTGPSGTLYYQPTVDTLFGTACSFGSIKLYTDGTNRIIEGQGNVSKPIMLTHQSFADICIGDALLSNSTGSGIVVSDSTITTTVYGDLSCVPDALANTTGFISAQGGFGLVPDGLGLASAEIRFYEATANGSNYVGFKAPSTIAANKIWTLPSADGTSGQVLSTNGSGTLSWVTAGGGGGSGTVTSITPAADSGTGTAITTSGTITISGTAGEIETTVSGTTVTLNLAGVVDTGAIGGILQLYAQGII